MSVEGVGICKERKREGVGIYKKGEKVVNTSYQKLNFQ